MKIILLIMLSLAIIYGVYFGNAENPVNHERQTIKKQPSKTVVLKSPSKRILDINKQLESIEKEITKMDDISKDMKAMVKSLKSVLATAKSNRANRLPAIYKELLALNRQLQMESRQYNTISNALKARRDTEMAAIRNLK